ncbi:BA14K family protein [Mesorhizobium temperatum]|uniref:Lectin-like protein BA14k n=1 Tax=Mesorhizobium temperatum TaxID=241416 RepID=A0A271LIT6_9HYPH|nr:BA14K family protein [Mesorhizobium temperatum]PAQ07240.1 BA14K family protein [Mesorhizobium temperatum]
MKSLLYSSVRSGVITLGLLAGMAAPSLAGPIIQPDLPVPANAIAPEFVPVRESWAGGNDRQLDEWRWRRHGDAFKWRGRHDAFKWRGRHDDFRWRGRHEARRWHHDDGWRWRHRRHHRRHFNDSAIFFGLGLGLPAYHYYNNYNYYDYYDYYVPPAPRRYYRTQRLSSAHVQWCYDRYRSYRAWDNTFQPHYGPRRQCISPYS